MTGFTRAFVGLLVVCGSALLGLPGFVVAKNLGANPPCLGCAACGCSSQEGSPGCDNSCSGVHVSETEGSVCTTAPVNGGGTTRLPITIAYNSNNADGTRAYLDLGLGYGWTHSYHQFLFAQRGHMFLLDGRGQVTRFRRSGANSYTASLGYFQTLATNPDGSFTLTDKDETSHRFERIPGDTLQIVGPVWRLKRVTRRNDQATEYDYDTAGRLSQVHNLAFGDRLRFAYGSNGHLRTITDPASGRTTTLDYDGTGRKLLKATEPPAAAGASPKSTAFSYNARYQLTGQTDRAGRSLSVAYRNGMPVGVTDSANQFLVDNTNPTNWAIDQDALARNQMRQFIPSTTIQRDGVGNLWRVSYDANGYVTRRVAPDGAVTSTTYDSATLLPATETDANGNVTSHEYDDRGNRVKQTDAKGFVTTYAYGAANPGDPLHPFCPDQVSRITYPNGSITAYEYDTSLDANGLRRCNRTREIRDLGGLALVTQWQYDSRGLLIRETDPNGHATEHAYDTAGNLDQIIDAELNLSRFAYDSSGNRTCAVDGNGHVSVYEYDALNRLIRETVKIGISLAYNDPIAPACVPAGADDIITAEYSYDGTGNRTLVRRQFNVAMPREWQVTKYEYDYRNRLVRDIKDPAGEPLNTSPSPLNLVTVYTYDGNNNRSQVTDPLGNKTTYTYDSQNRLTKVKDALNNETQTRYDPAGNRVCAIDANQHYTFYQYDELNRLTTQARKMGAQECSAGDADDLITRNFYDSGAATACFIDPGSPVCAGPMPGGSNIAYSIDPEQRYTHFKYDKIDRRWVSIRKVGPYVDTTGVCDANDWCDYTQYDAANNVLARVDANHNRTALAYFTNDWMQAETIDPGGLSLVTRRTYDGAGNVATLTNARGNVRTNTYDERNQLRRAADSVGLVASYDYDGAGNRRRECDGNGNCTLYGYDAVNRLVDSTDPLGNVTGNAYDPDGNLIKVTDREGHASCHYYDVINRRTRTAQLTGGTDCAALSASDPWTDTGYDAVGKVTRLATARHSTPADCDSGSPPDDCQTTSYQYDAADRLLCEAYADQTTRCFVYDKAGNLTQRTDQLGQVTRYVYSDLYNLALRDYQDPAEPDDSFAYDIGGRMTRAERDGWVVTYAGYDPANRVLQSTQDATGTPMTVQYAYDTTAGTRDLVYPGGRVCHEQRDLRDRLVDVTCDSFDGVYAYDLGNRVLTRVYNNGVAANYGYDANNRITWLNHANGGIVADFGYGYDKEGNKQYEDKAHDPARSEAYAYDDLYRLIDYKVGALVGSTVPLPTTQTQYFLDKVGNWDQFATDNDGAGPGLSIVYQNTPNQMNEYDDPSTNGPGEIPDDLGIPYNFKDLAGTPTPDGENWAHDKNGNRREDGQRVYAYDDENRLIRVIRKSDNLVSEYRYDALSRRVVKAVGVGLSPVTTRYAYDDARIIEDQDGAAATLATYVYGNYVDEVLNMQRGGADYYYHQNALWSVVAVSDASAVTVERYTYTDYGCPSVIHSAIHNPWMLTGRQWDEESELYFYRARYYDCETGRFMQRDPKGYVEGVNLYEYVGSSPVNFVDPLGLGILFGECCNSSGGVEWALMDQEEEGDEPHGKWYKLLPGECVGGRRGSNRGDCDGMTCGGAFTTSMIGVVLPRETVRPRAVIKAVTPIEDGRRIHVIVIQDQSRVPGTVYLTANRRLEWRRP